jgi:uncharacterized protein YjbI with pentapeptide repeats
VTIAELLHAELTHAELHYAELQHAEVQYAGLAGTEQLNIELLALHIAYTSPISLDATPDS